MVPVAEVHLKTLVARSAADKRQHIWQARSASVPRPGFDTFAQFDQLPRRSLGAVDLARTDRSVETGEFGPGRDA